MKPSLIALIIFIGLSTIAIAQPSAVKVPTFTERDREFGLKYMSDTKADFVKELTGISDAQLNFRAAEGRWTIAEIAEHIIVVEHALFGMFTDPKAAMKKCDDAPRVADIALILAITNRTKKFTAPAEVAPNGRWKTREELLAHFEKTRGASMAYIKDNKADLRSTFVQSPMGMVDGFQAMLFMTGHSERHLLQLKEVKADPKYPKS
jgi:hypothetical protein